LFLYDRLFTSCDSVNDSIIGPNHVAPRVSMIIQYGI